MVGGSLSDMVSDSVSFTAGSSVGFSIRKPQTRNTGVTHIIQKHTSPRQSPDVYEYSNSLGSTPRRKMEYKDDMSYKESEFNNFGLNMKILEEAS